MASGYRPIVMCALAGMLANPAPTAASAQTRFLEDGQPVQVRIHQTTRDRNHDENHIQRALLQASDRRETAGKVQSSTAGLQPPLRRGLSNTNPDIAFIAAYVDHDEARPDSLLDWNCGERTYDTDTFNHNGTDYNGAEYPWLTMADDGMIVVAAADGKIIERHDGEPDQNCSFDLSSQPNLVVLEHADRKVTIYAHMKQGSITPRKVGDLVEQGDYLGVMGSSGLSSGPHLHFGVQDRSNNLFDPYAGACNSLNNQSLWENQEAYKERRILSLATHSTSPEYPPCPQLEVPHFKNVFTLQDTVYASVNLRDFDDTDELGVSVRDPDGRVVLSTTFTTSEPGLRSAITVIWGFQFGPQDRVGKYTWEATYGGNTEKHAFYVGSSPSPPLATKPSNNAFTGLWYDPTLDGEGFNIITASSGTIIYFYGSDDRGNRVWLVSDLLPGEIKTGQTIKTLMYESSGGVFQSPVPSGRGLSIWGTLDLIFTDCNGGQSVLTGVDGSKISQLAKLVGVSGSACVAGEVLADAPWAGLWYDPASDGEGYNLIVAPVGRILYFYGFHSDGLRLWLVSELITATLEIGLTVQAALFESNQGTFSVPVASGEALVPWGIANITLLNCNSIRIVIDGSDGRKTSNTVLLAGIIGSSCDS